MSIKNKSKVTVKATGQKGTVVKNWRGRPYPFLVVEGDEPDEGPTLGFFSKMELEEREGAK